MRPHKSIVAVFSMASKRPRSCERVNQVVRDLLFVRLAERGAIESGQTVPWSTYLCLGGVRERLCAPLAGPFGLHRDIFDLGCWTVDISPFLSWSVLGNHEAKLVFASFFAITSTQHTAAHGS